MSSSLRWRGARAVVACSSIVLAAAVLIAQDGPRVIGQQDGPRMRPLLFGLANTAFIYPSDTVRPMTNQILGQALWFSWQAYFWDSNAGQMRPGFAGLVNGLAPGIVGHYPGIGVLTHDFQWKRVIGPLSRRTDPTPRERVFDTPLETSFGPDEYGRMLEQLRAGSSIPIAGTIEVNIMSDSVQDAADWVEYMNAPNDGSNPGGGTDWAAVRAANGHPAPYNIHYWELGNEPSYTAENIGSLTVWQYIDRINAFVPAMKQRDPSIEVTAYVNPFSVGNAAAIGTPTPDLPAGAGPSGPNNLTWTQALIQNAGAMVDILHFHWFGAWNQAINSDDQIETSARTGLVPWLDRLQQDIDGYAPNSDVKTRLKQHVAVAEWNSFGGFTTPIAGGTAMLGAIGDSRILHVLAGRPEVVYASRLALAAPTPAPPLNVPAADNPILDVRQGYFAIWTNPAGSQFVQTAVYQVGQLWGRALLARTVRSDASGMPSANGVPLVDVSSFASADNSQVSIVITNASGGALPLTCSLDRYAINGSVTELLVQGANVNDNNSFGAPNRVQMQTQTFSPSGPNEISLSVPAQSVVALLVSGRTM